jgi:hypothetical protein
VAAPLVWWTVTLAMIVLAPVIVLVGEPVRRHFLRRLRRKPLLARAVLPGVGWRSGFLAWAMIRNPVLIALTAPARWAIDRASGLRSGRDGRGRFGLGQRGGQGGDWPPSAGDREPRRPRPTAPAGAIALAEPRQHRRVTGARTVIPSATSELARRVGPRLRRMTAVLRGRLRHQPS